MKKVMSLVLALTMCVGLCVPAFAANGPNPPAGYTYVRKTNGNTQIDAKYNSFSGLVSCTIVGFLGGPVGSAVAFVVAWADLEMNAQTNIDNNNKFTGYYTKWTYECDDPGIYPYIFWHYIEFYSDSSRTKVIATKQFEEFALLPRMAG